MKNVLAVSQYRNAALTPVGNMNFLHLQRARETSYKTSSVVFSVFLPPHLFLISLVPLNFGANESAERWR